MYEHGSKTHSSDQASKNSSATSEAERRVADRHVFTASAEVVELGSGARFATRTTDLGPGGCFVDTMVPFPVGAKVRVSVRKGQTQFETGGIVVYSQTGLGMGIAFDTMEPHQRQALDSWLIELTGGRQTLSNGATLGAGRFEGNRTPATSPTAVRLIQLLISKGILTEAEGSSVLIDPFL